MSLTRQASRKIVGRAYDFDSVLQIFIIYAAAEDFVTRS